MIPAPLPELLEFLKPYDEGVRQLALALRALVLEELSPCRENIYDAYNAVAIGYGSSPRLRDGICHIAVYSKHVNLGFNKGALLPDPARRGQMDTPHYGQEHRRYRKSHPPQVSAECHGARGHAGTRWPRSQRTQCRESYLSAPAPAGAIYFVTLITK